MRWRCARVLYKDDDATLDDLREAVTTLEDAERTRGACSVARTRHNGSLERRPRARAALRARDETARRRRRRRRPRPFTTRTSNADAKLLPTSGCGLATGCMGLLLTFLPARCSLLRVRLTRNRRILDSSLRAPVLAQELLHWCICACQKAERLQHERPRRQPGRSRTYIV